MFRPFRLTVSHLKRGGADYADVRLVRKTTESIAVKNSNVESLSRDENHGFGIRVLHSGAWGFAASSIVTPAEMKRVADEAIEIAKASATTLKRPVVLAECDPYVDSYASKYEIDPFQVPLEEKTALLLEANSILLKDRRAKVAKSNMDFYKTHKFFASTEGALLEQEILESGAGMEVTAIEGGEVQKRSYPSSHGGDFATRGYEFVKAMDLIGNAGRVREEAVALLKAKPLPSTNATIIITGSQMALQVHESCGHPTELDRVLGTEISLAGGSFLSLDKLNSLQYGSKVVDITADATLEGGLGSFAYDDEGVKAQRAHLVKEGRFVGYLTSRETAAVINQRSNGTMRADGWNRLPLIRMTNINLEPGEPSLEELIADTQSGYLLETNKSWSIDDQRLNFQFGVEIAWEIRHGKRRGIFKNPVYTGITPEFWNGCDAVCNRGDWHLWGVPNCGKGEPQQVMHVAHGASPARFHNVTIGVSR